LLLIWSSFVRVSSGYLGVQGIQPLFPLCPVGTEPFVDLGQRLGAQAVDAPLCLMTKLDESGLPQHS
jgi:hypothetical protein